MYKTIMDVLPCLENKIQYFCKVQIENLFASSFGAFIMASTLLILDTDEQVLWQILKVRKKAKIRNQNNQAPHLTQETTWESDKNTIKHHIQESQEVSPFPAGDHKAEMNRKESMTNMNH